MRLRLPTTKFLLFAIFFAFLALGASGQATISAGNAAAGDQSTTVTFNLSNNNNDYTFVLYNTSNSFPTLSGNPTGYTVGQVVSGATIANIQNLDGPQTGVTANISGLTNGTLYYFAIIAENTSGGPSYNYGSATVLTATPRPNAATNATPQFTSTCVETLDISWVNPSISHNAVVFARQGAFSATTVVADATSYTAGSISTGTLLASDGTARCVFNGAVTGGTTSTVSLSGLAANTSYSFIVYQYDELGATDSYSSVYQNATPITKATVDPATGATAIPLDQKANIAWTNPTTCFDEIIVVAKQHATTGVTGAPQTPATYASDGANVYGSGTFYNGTDATEGYIVYKGTGTSVQVTGLTNGQNYFFKVFARKGTVWSTGTADFSATPLLSASATSTGISNLTGNGSNLVGGTANVILFGFSATSTGTQALNTVSLTMANPSAKLTNIRLYASNSGDASTLTFPGSPYTGSYGTTTYDFTTTGENLTTTNRFYFLVADVNSSVAQGATFTNTLASAGLVVGTGSSSFTTVNYGTTYTFDALRTTVANHTAGLTSNAGNIVGGTSNIAIYGFSAASTGAQNISAVRINLAADPTGTLTNFRLVATSTATFNTTLLSSGATVYSGGTYANPSVNFTTVNENITTTTKYFYLVADVSSGVADAAQATPSLVEATPGVTINSTPGGSFVSFGTIAGSTYTFDALEATIDQTGVAGLTPNGSPIQGGTTIAMFGFRATSTGGQNISAVSIDLAADPANVLTNFRLVATTTATFNASMLSSGATVYTGGTYSNPSVNFATVNENISSTPKYFFLVADVSGNVADGATATASLVTATPGVSVNVSPGGSVVGYGTLAGSTYTFDALEATLDQTSVGGLTSSASPIVGGTSDIAVFGFRATSTGTQNITAVRFNLAADPTGTLTSFRLVVTTTATFTTSLLSSGATVYSGGSYSNPSVNFTGVNEDINSTPKYFFLVANVAAGVADGATATASLVEATPGVSINASPGGTILTYGPLNGSTYTFDALETTIDTPGGLALTSNASPIVGGTSNIAIFGFRASSTGSQNISAVRVNMGNPSGTLTNLRLVATTSATSFSTGLLSAGATVYSTGSFGSGSYNFTTVNENVVSGSPVYFFLVADVASGVADGATNTPSLVSATPGISINVSPGGSVVSYGTIAGSTYTFDALETTVDVPGGLSLTSNATAIVGGTTNIAIFGFRASSTGSQNISAARINMGNPSGIITNLRLVATTTSTSFNTGLLSAGATVYSPGSYSGGSFNFTSVNENVVSGTPVYFFLVADVSSSVADGATITPSLVFGTPGVTINASPGGSTINYGTLAGSTYTFDRLETTYVTETNSLGTGPLEAGTPGVAIIGINASSTGSQTWNSMQVTFTATPSQYSAFRLYRSTDNTFDGGDTNIKTGSLAGSVVSFTTLGESVSSTNVYYFVVADVAQGVNLSTSSIGASITSFVVATGFTNVPATISSATYGFRPSDDGTIVLSGGTSNNIDFTAYTSATTTPTTNSVRLGSFDITDNGDGGPNDTDNQFTRLTDITFALVGSSYLKTIGIFDGTTMVQEKSVTGASVSFSGLSLQAADNSTKTFDVRVTFNNTALAMAGIVDKTTYIGISIAAATADGTVGSTFAASDAGGATTTSAQNRLDVIATALDFVTPVAAAPATNFLLTVRAVDTYINIDTDRTSTVTVSKVSSFPTAGGAFTPTNPSGAMVSGSVGLTFQADQASDYTISATTNATPSVLSANTTFSVASLGVLFTGPSNQTLCYSGNYVVMTTISIQERDKSDIKVGTNKTYSFALPDDFSFNTSITPTPVVASGTDVTSISAISYTGTTIAKFTITTATINSIDEITISGLQIRYDGSTDVSNQKILRVGGSATITGSIPDDAGTPLGTLAASSGAVAPAGVTFLVSDPNNAGLKVSEQQFSVYQNDPIYLTGYLDPDVSNTTVDLTNPDVLTAIPKTDGTFSGQGVFKDNADGIYKFYPNQLTVGSYPIRYAYNIPSSPGGCKLVAIKDFVIYTSSLDGIAPGEKLCIDLQTTVLDLEAGDLPTDTFDPLCPNNGTGPSTGRTRYRYVTNGESVDYPVSFDAGNTKPVIFMLDYKATHPTYGYMGVYSALPQHPTLQNKYQLDIRDQNPNPTGLSAIGISNWGSCSGPPVFGFWTKAYTNVPVVTVTGTGSGALATVTVSYDFYAGTCYGLNQIAITTPGSGYKIGDQVTFNASDVGISGIVATVSDLAKYGYRYDANTIQYAGGVYLGYPLVDNYWSDYYQYYYYGCAIAPSTPYTYQYSYLNTLYVQVGTEPTIDFNALPLQCSYGAPVDLEPFVGLDNTNLYDEFYLSSGPIAAELGGPAAIPGATPNVANAYQLDPSVPGNTTKTDYYLHLKYEDPGSGCKSDISKVVTITPPPPALDPGLSEISNVDIAYCKNSNIAPPTVNISAGSDIFRWFTNYVSPGDPANILVATGNTFTPPLDNTTIGVNAFTVVRVTDHTTTFAGCDGVPLDFEIQIDPTMDISLTAPAAICSSGALTLSTTNPSIQIEQIAGPIIPGVPGTWSTNGDGSFSPTNALGSALSYTPGPNDKATGSVSLTLTSPDPNQPTYNNSVCPIAQSSFILPVYPAATADAGSDQVFCSSDQIQLSGSFSNASTTQWSVVSGGTGSGINNPSAAATNYTITPVEDLINAPFQITFRLTSTPQAGVSPTCPQVTDDVIMTINPRAKVNAGNDALICESLITTDTRLDLSTIASNIQGIAGLGGSWSLTAGGSGDFRDNTAVAAQATWGQAKYFYPSAAELTNRIVNLRLTSDDPDGAGPCPIVVDDIELKMNLVPRVEAGADFVVCAGDAINLQATVSGSTTSVNWSTNGAGSIANVLSPITSYTPSGLELITNPPPIRMTIVTDDPDASGPCVASTDIVNVKINRRAIVNAGADLIKCASDQITMDGSIPASSSGDPNATTWGGWSGGSGTFTNGGALNAVYVPSATELADGGQITLTLSSNDPDGSEPCPIETDTKIVTLNPTPEKPIDTSPKTVYCVNDIPQNLTAQGTVSGSILRWYDDAALTNLRYTGTSFNTAENTVTDKTVPFYVTQIAYADPSKGFAGCQGPAEQIDFIVNPLPEPHFSVANLCLGDDMQLTDLSTVKQPATGARTIDEWAWRFEDGDVLDIGSGTVASGTHGGRTGGTYQNPTHRFTNVGNYNIRLLVKTSDGCTNFINANGQPQTNNQPVRVGPVPAADFAFGDICDEVDVTKFVYTGTIKNQLASYAWDFADVGSTSNTATIDNPTHQFTGVNVYPVQLTVTTDLGCVNTIVKNVAILPFINSFSYRESFESVGHGWVTQGFTRDPSASSGPILNSWSLMAPGGLEINSASDGTKVWITNNPGTGTYSNSERSVLYGPCVDLTQLPRPVIGFDYWNSTHNNDGAYLEYSLNGGQSWIALGSVGSGLEWYNESGLTGLSQINGVGQTISQIGWSGKTNGWQSAKYNLDFLSTETKIRFRFVFGSNGDNPSTGTYDGFAMDNFLLESRDRLVLVENFTNLNGNVTANNDNFRQFKAQTPGEVVKVQYHTNFPTPDDLNKVNPADPSARASFYGVTSSPVGFVNGYTDVSSGASFLGAWSGDRYDLQSLVPADLAITIANPVADANADVNGKLDFSVTVTANKTAIPADTYSLFIGVIENGVNGEDFVLRKLIPNASGSKLPAIALNGTFTLTESFVVDAAYVKDITKLAFVAFVQADQPDNIGARKVLQAAINTNVPVIELKTGLESNFLEQITLYPNPADEEVTILLPAKATSRVDVQLLDQVGKSIARTSIPKGEREKTLNVRDLPGAIYLIKLEENGRTTYKRAMVVHRN